MEAPGGGCDDPRAVEERVVLDLPMHGWRKIPNIAMELQVEAELAG